MSPGPPSAAARQAATAAIAHEYSVLQQAFEQFVNSIGNATPAGGMSAVMTGHYIGGEPASGWGRVGAGAGLIFDTATLGEGATAAACGRHRLVQGARTAAGILPAAYWRD